MLTAIGQKIYWIINDYVDFNIKTYSMQTLHSMICNVNSTFIHPNQSTIEIKKYFNENDHFEIKKYFNENDHLNIYNTITRTRYQGLSNDIARYNKLLSQACLQNNLEMVVSSVYFGANINYIDDNGDTPLTGLLNNVASAVVHLDIIYFLLSFDNINLNHKNKLGYTAALFQFCTSDSMEILEILLYSGANIYELLNDIKDELNSNIYTYIGIKDSITLNFYKLQTIILDMIFDLDIQNELKNMLNHETALILDLCHIIVEYTPEYIIQPNLYNCLFFTIQLIKYIEDFKLGFSSIESIIRY